MKSVLIVTLVCLGFYGQIALSVTTRKPITTRRPTTSTARRPPRDTTTTSTESTSTESTTDIGTDSPTDPFIAQCQTLMSQYGGGYYYQGAVTYTLNDCTVSCFSNASDQGDTYYSNDYPGSAIQSMESTYQIDATINDMQSCGKDMVCYQGQCMKTKPEFKALCKQNTGNDSIALQGSNGCAIDCISQDNSSSDDEYYNSYYQQPSLYLYNIYLPERYNCGTGHMCSEGNCIPATMFPKCPK